MSGDAKRALLRITVSVCSLALVGCHGRAVNSKGATKIVSRPPETILPLPPVKAGDTAMGWTLASSQHIKLSDYQGQVVVLDFYATWCEPCRASIPHLVDLQKRYGSRGLQVIGLNVGGQDDYQEVPGFAREFQIQYPLGIPDAELENAYLNDNAIPQTLVLDRKGQLLEKFVGYDDSMTDQLERVIQSSLSAAAAK
jgi:thiol-disulfide isomerase/thioredoxin